MDRRKNRNAEAEGTVEGTTEATQAEGTKRAPRPQIDTGNVSVAAVDDETAFGGRSSKLDSDPVAVAVRDAVDGQTYALNVEADKVEGVLSIARRAGARFGKGLRFDTRRKAEGVILFKTGPKRQIKAKTEAPAEGTDSAE